MRIVCIDDDKTFLTIYKKVLEKHAMPEDDLLITADPLEVISTFDTTKVDLLITDLVMPEMSGLELLEKCKQLDPSIEVIVVTGQGSIDSAVEAMRLGARDYLTKPLNTGMLIEKIDNIREFIGREKEAEDYRFAKETIEENAMRSVAEMEIKLDTYITLSYDIESVINSEEEPDEKIEKIAGLVKSCKENL